MSSAPLNTASSAANGAPAQSATSTTQPIPRPPVRKKIFFLTVPGVIRLLEIFLSILHIGAYGYYSTYYDRIVDVTLAPFFLSATREAFFIMVNFHTFLSAFAIVVAIVVSARSHTALSESLYFLMMTSASVGLILLYQEQDARAVYAQSTATRQGLSVTGMLLGCLHLIGSIYDLAIYVRRNELRVVEP